MGRLRLPHAGPCRIAALCAVLLAGRAIRAQNVVDAGDTLQLTGLQEKFTTVARRVSPSVVAVSSSMQAADSDAALRGQDLNGQKLESLLERSTRVVGTGFVIDSDGYILTDEHVVGAAQSVWVTTDDGKVYPAVVLGSDPRSDLAVLKIPATGLPAVRFAPCDGAERGQWVIALGNPYGLAAQGENCLSVGVVSAVDRTLPELARKEDRLYSHLIQTTAQLNPGSSGGPLFDLAGRVIGVNMAVILPEHQTNGIGFALPVTADLLQAVRDMKEGKEIVYAYLGVLATTPTEHEWSAAGVADAVGARVDSIAEGSPAADAGIRAEDIIVRLNGQSVRDADHLVRLVGAAALDRPATLDLYRGGRAVRVSVTLQKRPASASAVTRQSRRFHWRGLVLGTAPPHWTTGANDGKGLLVLGVGPAARFARQPLVLGDVITAIAGRGVGDIADAQKIVNDLAVADCPLTVAGNEQSVVLRGD